METNRPTPALVKLARMRVSWVLMSALAAATTANAQQSTAQSDDRRALLDRIEALEKRLSELESSAVLSEPETRVKKIEVYVDKNGVETDEPVPGATKTVTYQRERVFRRQTISEKVEEALADHDSKSVKVGIDAAMVGQYVSQTKGDDSIADGHAYALASADLFFSAQLAQNTSLFADIVGLSGSPPDSEVGGLTLLNGYAARLVQQNQVNLREAWLRTELFDQKLALTFGRVDLTAFFDRNAAANDETTQFVSDALVNNPMLGLSSNGAGVAVVYDPRGSWNAKLGVQQSDPNATNLSQSLYTLAELGYRARPSFLGEGNYRVWYRTDNSADVTRAAYGVSLDQKLNDYVIAFGRYGDGEADVGHDHFYSVGFQFQHRLVMNPLDVWGIGYSNLELADTTEENLIELYYNLHLSEKLHLTFHLQHVIETAANGDEQGFIVPGLRIQGGL